MADYGPCIVRIEARVRRRVKHYNYKNVITITCSGHVWALDAARTLARHPEVLPNVQIRIQYRIGRTVTLALGSNIGLVEFLHSHYNSSLRGPHRPFFGYSHTHNPTKELCNIKGMKFLYLSNVGLYVRYFQMNLFSYIAIHLLN